LIVVDEHVIDLISDELGLARAQLDAGLASLAEGTSRRRLARIEADGGGDDEADALRLLLSESLWRQGRPSSARVALDAIRPGSAQRRLPMAMLIDAETLAAAGELDRAAGVQERLVAAVGVDAAFALRAGVTGRLAWPLPAELRPEPAQPARPPWTLADDGPATDDEAAESDRPVSDERMASGRERLDDARLAYASGDFARGDGAMSIAVRLDPGLASDGVAALQPTLGDRPAPERLLLYGDLLRAAGRDAEAADAYDRAADRRT
jgi:hypothetical protein